MAHEPKTYFREHEDDEVKGFTIIEVGDNRYRLAEKWNHGGETFWTDYWVSEADLEGRIEAGHCEKAGKLTDEQFEQVAGLTDQRVLA